MKIKTSMKICKGFKNVFSCGYCDLQYIFYGVDPKFYNCGVYGWNCDLFVDFSSDTIITTGYRNMRGKSIPYETIKKYDDIARNIINTYSWQETDKRNAALLENRNNFIRAILA